MKLTGITWITTYNCNIACDHCFFDTQNNKVYMNPEMVTEALASLQNTKHMFWQHLSGGEIFLNEKSLFQIIANIRKHFSKDLGLSTNAFWATDIELARKKVLALKKAGVTGLALSADYYHQQCMSSKGAENLAKVLGESGLTTHSYIMGARLAEGVEGCKEVNKKSDAIAQKVKGNLEIPYAKATERSIGKGSIINTPKKLGVPQGMCSELNTCLGERSPFNPAMVWIDPYGNVMICYGIIIGNLHHNSLNDIIENYSAEKVPLMQKLASKGPKALYQEALEKGINMPDSYFDECDVCYQSRKALRKSFPTLLGPNECYPV